jgi:iron(III) transport system permease protein
MNRDRLVTGDATPLADPPRRGARTDRLLRGPLVLVALALALLALTSARQRGLFVNTALLAGGSLVLALPLGTLLGVAVGKVDVPGRRLLAWMLVAMVFLPLYVQAGAWEAVLGRGGWLMEQFRGEGYADPWLAGWRGAVWVHGMAAVPWVALAVAASLGMVERKLEEDALLDAAPWRVLLRVSLRRAVGGLLAAAAWISVTAATEIAVSDLFQIRTFAEEVYTQAALGPLMGWSEGATMPPLAGPAPGGGASGATGGGPGMTPPSFATSFVPSELAIGVAALSLLVVAALWAMARRLPPADALIADAGWRWRPARGRLVLGAALWALVGTAVVVPLSGLAWKAGGQVHQVGGAYERSWSATKAASMVLESPWKHRREWGWSLSIAAMAAAGAAAGGLVCAWLVRLRSTAGSALAVGIALGLSVPAPLLAVWVIALLNQPPDSPLAPLAVLYDRTLTAPVLVQCVRALPLAALWMWSQLASVPQDLLDASESEGASWATQLMRIALPLRRTGVAAGLAAALVVALAEVSATLLVLPPGVMTVPVLLFQLLHFGVDDRLAALCLSLFVMVGGAVALAASLRALLGLRRVPRAAVG